ncbi:hypothetical protein CcCBS67573_g09400 [Chytriomyces confervae]|uniref:Transcription initiation factor TFIID subunit 10 n=1 Tax=Chytriomyces confervae TaxID=246404 RepID=A0A507DW87_9FUNG|nr:Transcription initiation factor TFIID subunit 10 [Chytriomyces hyalinus]TPX55974.1 hypothetical protein CcCBS67573_g09400 [Chytriomyces confervae]
MKRRGRPPKTRQPVSDNDEAEEEDEEMEDENEDMNNNDDNDDNEVESNEDSDNENANDEDGDDAEEEDDDKMRKKTRTEKDDEKREKALLDLLALMEDTTPLIPDAVTDYYLVKAGFECDDIRVKRLLALATQKFMADLSQDAFHYCKIRQQALSKDKKGAIKKTVMTIDDLGGALAEHGINIKKPDYFV